MVIGGPTEVMHKLWHWKHSHTLGIITRTRGQVVAVPGRQGPPSSGLTPHTGVCADLAALPNQGLMGTTEKPSNITLLQTS